MRSSVKTHTFNLLIIKIKKYFQSFTNLFFPEICIHCSKPLSGNEKDLCTLCLSKLPVTNYCNQSGNPIEKIFWGRILAEQASSFLYLEKNSIVQSIIYNLKYNGRKNIGLTMGRLFGNKLKNSAFANIDIIVPVPLHRNRKSKRGYNQSEIIALGIGEVLNKPVFTDVIKRIVPNKSQTQKGKYERWINAKDIFRCVCQEKLDGKHILIVDDIITTGATVESLICEIQKNAETKISIAVLASA